MTVRLSALLDTEEAAGSVYVRKVATASPTNEVLVVGGLMAIPVVVGAIHAGAVCADGCAEGRVAAAAASGCSGGRADTLSADEDAEVDAFRRFSDSASAAFVPLVDRPEEGGLLVDEDAGAVAGSADDAEDPRTATDSDIV